MKYVNKAFNFITVMIFVAMVLTVLLQIVFRQLLKMSVPWTEELSRLLFIYAGFFGTALAARDKQFIVIDVLFKRLPSKVKAVCEVFIKVFLMLFFGIMWVGAVKMAQTVSGTYFQSMPGVSNSFTYYAIIIGLAMTELYLVLESIEEIRKRGHKDA